IGAQIIDLMKDMKAKTGASILMITHDLGIIAEICDRVGVMYAGTIVELGDVVTIFKNPSHPYTNGLICAIPDLSTERCSRLEMIPGTVPNLIFPPAGCRFHPRCGKVMEICKKEKPKNVKIGEGHYVACHLYGGS
ncbi:MAG TPA: oligopeptide/dipeptide ABC transporter ATP-binding protein, partial [Methanocella sp.]|nr:oligopeptide/dipeptide ABC transporter ATP-binding protein [Methanocella sp.]